MNRDRRLLHIAFRMPGFVAGLVVACALLLPAANVRGVTLTWSFMPAGATSGDNANNVALSSFMPPGYEGAIAAAMNTWSSVADVQFVQVPDTGPSGADIRIGAHAMAAPFGSKLAPYAHAYFPAPTTQASDVHFNTNYSWVVGSSVLTAGGTSNDVYSVALHELGHAVFGIDATSPNQHTRGVVSVVNSPATSLLFTNSLMPSDIAMAQAVYGAAPGYVPPPQSNVQLTLLPSSQMTFTVSAFNGALSIPMSTPLSGTLDAFVGTNSGLITNLAINDASLGLQNMTGSALLFGLTETAKVVNPAGWLYAPNRAVAVNGQFDSSNAMFGLVDGSMTATGPFALSYDLFNSPLSIGTKVGGASGSVTLSNSSTPGFRTVNFSMPVQNSIQVDASILNGSFQPGQLVATVTINGVVNATGLIAVPEPSTWALAFIGAVTLFAGRRLLSRRGQRRIHRTMHSGGLH